MQNSDEKEYIIVVRSFWEKKFTWDFMNYTEYMET